MTTPHPTSSTMHKLWQDPEYRARMKEKQKSIGFRTYPIKHSGRIAFIPLFCLTIASSFIFTGFIMLAAGWWTLEQGGAVGTAVIGLLASMEV